MTPEQVTPELARELLAKAYPEPRFVDEWTAEEVDLRPVTVTAELVPLVEAAPALAELVANLHYEYAAQVEKDGHKYIITDSDEGHWLCGDDHRVLQDWHPCYMDAEEYADTWNNNDGKRDGTTARIVRRLVSEPEVAE